VSTTQARRLVQTLVRQATVDLDHFYYPDGHSASDPPCTDGDCRTASLVGFTEVASGQCGELPTIGMVDTAIDLKHEALKDADIEIVARPGEDVYLPSGAEHGTAIATLLVGRTRAEVSGLVPDARVIAVDAFYRDGSLDDKTDAATLVEAIDLLVERGVKIINLSLSGPANTVLESAIRAAQERGVVFVAAAGNGGPGAEPSYPAAYPGVIAVTAVGHDLRVYPRASRGEYIILSAPGVRVQPAGSGTPRSGTSYAVPFVTAAAALLRGRDASLTPASIAARLETSARDLGDPGHDATFGWGLLQAQDLCPRSPVPNLPTQLTTQAFGFQPSMGSTR
jgi:subtilisin family serine protease